MENYQVITIMSAILAGLYSVFQIAERVMKKYKQNSKIKQAIHLKELIITRNDLESIQQKIDEQNQPILHQKITLLLSSIEEEINASESGVFKHEQFFKNGFAFFFGFISLLINDWLNLIFLLGPYSIYSDFVVFFFILFIVYMTHELTPRFAK